MPSLNLPDALAGLRLYEPTDAGAEAAIAARLGIRATAARDVSEALRLLAEPRDSSARILICGSLYLAGAVLRENEKL